MKHYIDNSDCTNCAKKRTSIFCMARMELVAEVNQHKICNYYRKGQILFNEGSYPFGIFCISTGKVKLSHHGDDGKEQITRLLRGGDILGYRAVLSGERYGGTAVALEDSKICFIPREAFISLLKNDPSFSFEVMRLLSVELHKAEMRITHLAQKPVRERLAETLLFIRETYGYELDGATLNVRLSREELANLVGTATESTIRLLSEFKRDGVIELDGKKIKITNSRELLHVANLQD